MSCIQVWLYSANCAWHARYTELEKCVKLPVKRDKFLETWRQLALADGPALDVFNLACNMVMSWLYCCGDKVASEVWRTVEESTNTNCEVAATALAFLVKLDALTSGLGWP